MPIEQLFTAPNSEATAVSQPKRRRWGRRILIVFLSALIVVVGLIGVTEAGLLNTGIDRLYGKTSLALMWGSMPADTETSLRTALAYVSQATLPEQFTISDTTTAEATIYMDSLNNLFDLNNTSNESPTPASTETESIQFFQMIDSTVDAFPSQTEIGLSDSPAPAFTNSPVEDITSSASLRIDGSVAQAGKQFALTVTFSASSTIPNWKSLQATSTVTRDNDTLFVQIPDLTQWPLGDAVIAPYSAYYGKYIEIPIPEDLKDELIGLQDYSSTPALTDEIISSIAARTRRIGIERIDGHAASHWQFSINKDSLITLAQDIETAVTAEQIELAQQWLPEFSLGIDVWIRHGDYAVVKSSTALVIDSPYLAATLQNDSHLTNLPANQAVTITTPDQAEVITLEELSDTTPTPICSLENTSDCLTSSDPGSSAYQRDQQRVSDLSAIQNQLESRYLTNSGYPTSAEVSRLDDPTTAVAVAIGTYTDPTPEQYYYGYRSDGQTYTLSAVIEDSTLTTCTPTGPICLYTIER